MFSFCFIGQGLITYTEQKRLMIILSKHYRIIVTLLFAIASTTVLAEKRDSVLLRQGMCMLFNDTIITPKKDTTLLIPSNKEYHIMDQVRYENSLQMYDKLRIQAEKSWATRMLSNAILFNNINTKFDKDPTKESANDFKRFEGKTIRAIKTINISSIPDSITNGALERVILYIINKTNNEPSDKVLNRFLLIKSGDKLNPDILSINEHIIRTQSFISEAEFYIEDIDSTTVDVLLATKSPWSKFGELDVSPKYSKLTIGDKNILGSGNEFSSSGILEKNGDYKLGYALKYKQNNPFGKFLTMEATLHQAFYSMIYKIEIQRPSIFNIFKNYGAISFSKNEINKDVILKNDTITKAYFDYLDADVWIGRTFGKVRVTDVPKFVLSTRYRNIYYKYTLPNEIVNRTDYNSRQNFIMSTIIGKEKYYKTSMIYTYGQTEDFTTGYKANITSGVEWTKNSFRNYLSGQFSFATYSQTSGYFYGLVKGASFINEGHLQQSTFIAKAKYISPLIKHNRSRFRQFATINYQHTENMMPNDYLLFTNNELTGLSGIIFDSKNTLSAQLETVWFTPIYYYGFRPVAYMFFDNILANNNSGNNNYYNAVGLGIRIHNSNLLFNTIQIQFAYYPRPYQNNGYTASLGTRSNINTPNFRPEKPDFWIDYIK